MRHKILATAILLFSTLMLSDLAIAEYSEESVHSLQRIAIVKELVKNNDGTAIILTDNGERLKLVDQKDRDLAMLVLVGDRISTNLDNNNPDVIREITAVERPTSEMQRSLALGAAFLTIFLLATLAAGFKPLGYIIGADHRYSNSKLQMVLWFSALMTVYLATVGLRITFWGWDFLGGVELTENLLSLSGFSILTYGAAKAITQHQANNVDHLSANTAPNDSTEAITKPSITKDFFRNHDGVLDLGDTQMFFISLLVTIIFLLLSFQFLGWITYTKKITLPDIDTTLLAVFGLGQGAYLIKKAATPFGKG